MESQTINNMPLVSIIIPVYNVEKYIKECLESVINQTYKNLEIILVDDGSPDNCGKICDEYSEKDSRIHVIHKANGGVSSARNAGIEASTGEWIYFCDPDDWIELDLIKKALGFSIKNNCDMCMFDYNAVYKNKYIHHDGLKNRKTLFTELNDSKLFFDYSCSCGTMCNVITKSNIIKQLRFDESFSCGEDELYKFQLYSKMNSFCYIKEDLYYYRNNSLSSVNLQSYSTVIAYGSELYKRKKDIIKTENYSANALKAIHSKYLELFGIICIYIFEENCPLSLKIKMYNDYISSMEFLESIKDFDNSYFSKFTKICLINKKAPHWTFVYLLFKVRSIRQILIKNEQY